MSRKSMDSAPRSSRRVAEGVTSPSSTPSACTMTFVTLARISSESVMALASPKVLSEPTETNAADLHMPPAGRCALTAAVIREDAADLADHGGVSLALVARRHEHLGHDAVQMGALVGD